MKKRSIEDDRRHYCNDCFPSIEVCCQIETTNFDLNGYEAPYGTKLIFFYRRDVFHSDSHFTNRNDGFYLSQWWTLLIELKVSIISIAFLSIDRCTHRNFHIDRTITKHRLIDLMYRSIDTKGPSIDTKGPSIDTKGPSIDTKGPSIDAKGPSIDRYEGSIAIDTKGPS